MNNEDYQLTGLKCFANVVSLQVSIDYIRYFKRGELLLWENADGRRPGSEVYVHDEERLYAVREQNIDDCHGQATWQFVHTSCLYFS